MSNIKSIVVVLAVMLMLTGIGMANDSVGNTLGAGTNTPPTVYLNGASDITIQRYTTYVEMATANETVDGVVIDLTSSITTEGNVNISAVGNYVLNYTITNSNGTSIATRTVHVIDTIAPEDVTNLHVGLVNSTSIELIWSNTEPLKSPDFTTILVSVVKHSDGTPVLTKEPIGKVESYIINNLSPGTAYDITVYTRDDQL